MIELYRHGRDENRGPYDQEQGRAMGNNQSMQVGAEALSGVFGGALAAVLVRLPLLAFAGAAVAGALMAAGLRRTDAVPAVAPAPD